MGLLERNVAQIDVFKRVAKERAASMVARCTCDWQAWERDGYAAAFDEAWKRGERDPETISRIVLATAERTRTILARK